MKLFLRLALVVLCVLSASGAALVNAAPAVDALPPSLEVPANQTLALTLTARGVQIYVYRAVAGEPDKFEWSFKAPEADLFDAQGRQVGRHYAGPTWELADGGKVVGKVKAKADAPGHQGVPWLLLDVMQASGPTLGKVQSIQRIDTVGGSAPTDNASTAKPGQEARVEYTATYKFYVAKP